MKIGKERKPLESKVDMTPMIDIVFQLLVFFIMTFKIVTMEGDFKVKMPIATTQDNKMDEVFPTVLHVKIAAGDTGGVAQVEVDTDGDNLQTFTNDWPGNLTAYVENVVAAVEGDPSTAQDTEVEFDIDFSLRYLHTVKAIESVSGIIEPDRSIKKLIEKIKFKSKSRD